jgi:hypothetical protein
MRNLWSVSRDDDLPTAQWRATLLHPGAPDAALKLGLTLLRVVIEAGAQTRIFRVALQGPNGETTPFDYSAFALEAAKRTGRFPLFGWSSTAGAPPADSQWVMPCAVTVFGAGGIPTEVELEDLGSILRAENPQVADDDWRSRQMAAGSPVWVSGRSFPLAREHFDPRLAFMDDLGFTVTLHTDVWFPRSLAPLDDGTMGWQDNRALALENGGRLNAFIRATRMSVIELGGEWSLERDDVRAPYLPMLEVDGIRLDTSA